MGRTLRFLELRAGEGVAFARAFFVIALTIAGHTLLETARDALFLESLPPAFLTLVYVAVALGALVVSPMSTRLTTSAGARNALCVTLVVTAFGAAWFRYQPASPTLVFALYVFGALSATTLVAEFWLLASAQFTAAQGRRLFGPLAAGGVLGAVAGAGAATLLLMAFQVRALLAAATVCYLAAALIATFIDYEEDAQPRASAEEPAGASPLSTLARDAFVRRLAGIAAVSTALSVLVDYIFKASVWGRLDPGSLAPFFARYQLALNGISLVLQLFLTGKLVERLGVLGLVVLSPALLLGGGTLAALGSAGLVSAVLLKGSDAVLKNSVGRVGFELLWAPVAGRERVRGFVDGAVVRAAQAVAALALLPLTFRKTTSLTSLALAIVVLAGVWLTLSLRVRTPYIELFRRALRRGSLERELSLPELDLTAVETLLEALARPDPRDVIAAMNVLADRGRGRLIPALILHHKDESVLLRALELFGPAERTDWLPLGESLVNHDSPAVRLAAVRALALAGAEDALRRATTHADPALRALAALHLAQLAGAPTPVAALGESARSSSESSESLRFALIDAIAAHPTPDSARTLLALAERPELRSAVTQALSQLDDSESIPFLIGRLASRDDRVAARKALVRRGQPAFLALQQVLLDPDADRRVRLHAPRTLSAFENKAAVNVLLGVLRDESDGLVRYKALRGLEQLALRTSLPIDLEAVITELGKNCIEYLRLFTLAAPLRADPTTRARTSRSLALGLIEDKLHQSLDRIHRLVQIAQRGDDIPSVFAALRASDRHERARAIEFLDALARSWERTSDQTPRLLRLVVDELSDGERLLAAEPFVGRIASTTEALDRMAADSDPVLSEIARHALLTAERSITASFPPFTPDTPDPWVL
ncbi:MAG TPA: MFS transporter [Polyangiaceae bacterium]|nr:MFS transporter [Polyangiaceae bacterium]